MTDEQLEAIMIRCGAARSTTHDVQILIAEVRRLRAEVERLCEALRWIPCSERLPTPGKWLWVCMANSTKFKRASLTENRKSFWIDDDVGWYARLESVTHWRLEPEPPEVNDE